MDKKITSSVVLASFATAQFGILNARAADVSAPESSVGSAVSDVLTNTGGTDANKDVLLDGSAKGTESDASLGASVDLDKKESVADNLSEAVAEGNVQGVDESGEAGANSALVSDDGPQNDISSGSGNLTENADLNGVANEILLPDSSQGKSETPVDSALTEEKLASGVSEEIPGSGSLDNSGITGSGASDLPEKEGVIGNPGSEVTVGSSGKTSGDDNLNDELKQGETAGSGENKKDVSGKSGAFASIGPSGPENFSSKTSPSVFDRFKNYVGDTWNSWFGSKKQEKVTSAGKDGSEKGKESNKNLEDKNIGNESDKDVRSKDDSANAKNGSEGPTKPGVVKKDGGVVAADKVKKPGRGSERKKRRRKNLHGKKPAFSVKGPNNRAKHRRALKGSKSKGDGLFSKALKTPEGKMFAGSAVALGTAFATSKLMDEVVASKVPEASSVKGDPVENPQKGNEEKLLENTGVGNDKTDVGANTEVGEVNNKESSEYASGFWDVMSEKPVQNSLNLPFVVGERGKDFFNSCFNLWARNRVGDIINGEGEYFESFSDAVEDLGLKNLAAEDLLGKDSDKFVKALSKLFLTLKDIDSLVLDKDDDALGSILKKAGFSDDTVKKLLGDCRKDFLNLLDESAVKSDVFYSIVARDLGKVVEDLKKRDFWDFCDELFKYYGEKLGSLIPDFSYKKFIGAYKLVAPYFGRFTSCIILSLIFFIYVLKFVSYVVDAASAGRSAWNEEDKGSFIKFLATNEDVQALTFYFGTVFRHSIYPILLDEEFYSWVEKKYQINGDKVEEVTDLVGTFALWAKRLVKYPVKFAWNLLPPVYLYNWLSDWKRGGVLLYVPGASGGTLDRLKKEREEAWKNSAFVKGEARRKKQKEELEEKIRKKKQEAEENKPAVKLKKLKEDLKERIKKEETKMEDIKKEMEDFSVVMKELPSDDVILERYVLYVAASNTKGTFENMQKDLMKASLGNEVAIENKVKDVETDLKFNNFYNTNLDHMKMNVSLNRLDLLQEAKELFFKEFMENERKKEEENKPVNKFKKLQKRYFDLIEELNKEIIEINKEAERTMLSLRYNRSFVFSKIVDLYAQLEGAKKYIESLKANPYLSYLDLREGEGRKNFERLHDDLNLHAENMFDIMKNCKVDFDKEFESAKKARESSSEFLKKWSVELILPDALQSFFGNNDADAVYEKLKQDQINYHNQGFEWN